MNSRIFRVLEFAFLFLIGITISIKFPEFDYFRYLPNIHHLLAFCIFSYLDIYIHEFGHALAGMSVGFPIRKISIGTGRPIFKKKLGDMLLVITNNFGGGLTYMGEVSRTYLKPRFMVFVLGGVLAQILAVLIALVYLQLSGETVSSFRDITLIHIFIASNVLLIVCNLIPFYSNLGGMSYANDGMQFFRTPFAQEKDIQEILAAGNIREGYELYEAKQYSEAEAVFRECITRFPESLITLLNLGASLIKQMDLVEAQAVLEKAVTLHPKSPYLFLLNNNLAWTYFLQLTPQSIQEAEVYSRKAYELNATLPCVLGTRGCVLIEQDKVDEGIRLLTRFVRLNRPINDKTNTAAGFIYLAYGYYLNGDIDLSHQYLSKIEALGQDLERDYQYLLKHVMTRTNNFGRS